jgi:Uncharacterized protein involved in outer membrane biogenesis
LIRFLVLLPVSLVLLVLIAVGILYFQQQKLVALAVKELNKQLAGELEVGGSSISAFENFPYISIRMNNVRFFADKQKTKKPIYEADRMFIGFSLEDIINKKYHVKVIALRNGHLDLVQDNAGQLNIVKAIQVKSNAAANTTDTAATELDLDLKKVVLRGMKVTYLDQQTRNQFVADIERIQTSLKTVKADVEGKLEGKMILDYTRPDDTVLFRHKHLETKLEFSYNKDKQQVQLPVGKLHLEDAVFSITGSADMANDNWVDLKITGDNPNFDQLFSFVPDNAKKQLEHFKYNGRLGFEGIVKGKLKDGEMPLIELSFSCDDAWVHNTEADRKLDSLAFKGYYTNGAGRSLKTSELRILNMNAKPGKGIFKGNFVMRDFTDPKILMQVNGDLQLEFIGAFLGIKDLQRITGQVILKMDFKELVDISVPEESMVKLSKGIQSELSVRNLTFRIPGYPYIIEKLNMHADMKNGFVNLDSFHCLVGNSDLRMTGSISDLPAIFHAKEKPIVVKLNANSNKLVFKELLAFDTVRSNKAKEEIHHFNIGLALETSVNEILNPNPLPKGRFRIQNLQARFKEYPHVFKDFGAELIIEDTTLRLREFAGYIDSSDIRFSSRVNNYALWFDKVKRGKIQVAFDLKSNRLAVREVLGKVARDLLPRGYRREMATNLWIRTRTDIRYDSVFRFADVKIANISGELVRHPVKLDSIRGNVKFNAGNFIRVDSLRGKIGRSDFDINMRLYTGKDSARMQKENYLHFASRFLDVDQMSTYDFSSKPARELPAFPDLSKGQRVVAKRSVHADAFNIFTIPFIDFKATVDVKTIKFKRLWVKNFFANARMKTNQHLYLDTLQMDIADGNVAARGFFNGSNPEKIYLRSRIKVKEVDIEKMMLKLDYLGQDYVINKNVKGRLTGNIKCYVQVHPDLTPLFDHSEAELDLDIADGMLVNFAPMQALSSYFKDKNLNMVRFDTLRNKFTFKDGSLTFPYMNINSSLGFMEVSGKQALDMKMEYYLRIPLKLVTKVGFQMLFGKKEEEVDPDQIDAIEYRNMDKRVRFLNLKISGTPDDYKVSLGKAKKI